MSAHPTITLSDWQQPEHTVWSYRHMRELVPTARVRRAPQASELRPASPPAGELAVQSLLADARTDGLIVLRGDELLLEEYRRGMAPDDVHLLQSVSKSITGSLAGVLVDQGRLDTEAAVTEYVPELRDSSFEGATVRHLLDMRAGTKFDETYTDPDSDLRTSETQFGWAPGPRPAKSALSYMAGLANHRDHGGRFEYRSILTDMLGLVLQRASGTPFAQLLGDELWSRIGTENDAYVTVDGDGFAVTDGGVCVTLRDLARFGRMIRDGGTYAGEQVVPAAWLDDILSGASDSEAAFARSEHALAFPGAHYRNQWWVPAGGSTFLALGIHGQFLFVNRETRTVIALLSTWETSLDQERHEAIMRAFWETSRQLRDSSD
ncbi:MAG: serine hydrolase domain-containing protein [Solirubrobacteraceae bacterium]